ncbi:kinase-like domain-containing protein [Rhizophagus irregularis DAOM 181602=DAOM 197198]|nr:kinase-like domain-containing protein [Rhizophagus irregularis DAOM 181602=DAOM 197198]
MSNIRIDLVQATLMRAHASFDHGDFHEGYEFTQQIILTDESLTEEEKTDAIRENNKHYDRDKIFYNSGTRRICENSKWIDGGYEEWDSKEQQLLRFGAHSVILKELGNVEDANQSWFEEAKSHLTIGNKLTAIIKCYGITQNPSNGNYMLAIEPLMEQCWDANPLKRPDAHALLKKIREINSYYRNNPNELPQLIAKIEKKTSNIFSSKLFTSKIYKFENLPEPKNATKEEQEAFYTSSKLYDFSISDNSSIFSTISNQYTSINLKNRNEDNDKESSRLFKKLKMENETIQQEPNVDIIDEDEVYNNNPKFHLEEQDELKISDDDFNKLN